MKLCYQPYSSNPPPPPPVLPPPPPSLCPWWWWDLINKASRQTHHHHPPWLHTQLLPSRARWIHSGGEYPPHMYHKWGLQNSFLMEDHGMGSPWPIPPGVKTNLYPHWDFMPPTRFVSCTRPPIPPSSRPSGRLVLLPARSSRGDTGWNRVWLGEIGCLNFITLWLCTGNTQTTQHKYVDRGIHG